MSAIVAEQILLVERDGPVAVVILNRPERLNALSHDLARELRASLGQLGADSTVRAIVLTGAGRAFSAGADLRNGPSDAEDVLRTLYTPMITEMRALPVPLIAAVNGIAAGAGASITLACDLRVAATSARFQLSFVAMGLVPDAGSTWLLPRIIGATRAAEVVLLGKPVLAAQALDWGLVNEVVADEDLRARAIEMAQQVSTLASTVGITRRLIQDGWERSLTRQLDAEATEQGLAQYRTDYIEARTAFAEHRTPTFLSRTAGLQ